MEQAGSQLSRYCGDGRVRSYHSGRSRAVYASREIKQSQVSIKRNINHLFAAMVVIILSVQLNIKIITQHKDILLVMLGSFKKCFGLIIFLQSQR